MQTNCETWIEYEMKQTNKIDRKITRSKIYKKKAELIRVMPSINKYWFINQLNMVEYVSITSRITTNQMRFSQVNCVYQRNACQHFPLTSIRINGGGRAATHCPNGQCLVNPIQTNYVSIHFRMVFLYWHVWTLDTGLEQQQSKWYECSYQLSIDILWTTTIHIAQNKTPKMAFINGIFGLSAKQLNFIQSIPNVAFPDE